MQQDSECETYDISSQSAISARHGLLGQSLISVTHDISSQSVISVNNDISSQIYLSDMTYEPKSDICHP